MADKRIQQYPLKTTVNGNDLVLIADSSDVDANGYLKYKKVESQSLATSLGRATILTRAELVSYVNLSSLIQGGVYVISDAVSGTLQLMLFASDVNVVSELAINVPDGEIYTYDYANDEATNGFTTSILDLTPQVAPTYKRGRVWYDSQTETLSYYDDISGTSIQLGQEQVIRVRNSTGGTITNGTVVYINGATGQNPTIAKALSNADGTSNVIGIATHDISNNSIGKITTSGVVNNVDTSAFSDGALLYLSSSVAGGLTSTRPNSPNFAVLVGICLHSHATQGKIYVHPDKQGLGLGSANQILGVNNGATAQEYKTLSGTSNQVTVTNSVGGIILSLPQSIASTSSPTFAGLTLTTALGVASGGTGLSTTPTNGQLLIGNGTNYTLATLTGTANQVTVTNGAGSITLSLPQSIATTSTPQFASMGLGVAASTSYVLRASSNLTGNTVTRGIVVDGTIQSDSTTGAIGFLSSLSTQATSFTSSALSSFYSAQGTIGVGSTVTTWNGFHVDTSFTKATNNYGFRGQIASGTNRWNLYMDGTALNHLAGNTLIGSTTDGGEKLQVTGTARITGAVTLGSTLSMAGDLTNTQNTSTYYRVTANNNNAISGMIMTTGNGASLQTWQIASNASGASGELTIRDSTNSINAISIAKATGAVTLSGNLTVDTNTFFVDATNNRIGIGTASPLSGMMHLYGSAGASSVRWSEAATTIGFIGGANGLVTGKNGSFMVRGESGLVLSGVGNGNNFFIDSTGDIQTASATDTGEHFIIGGSARINGTATITGALTLSTALGVASGGTGLSSTPSNGQFPIGNGTNFTMATITGTANQVTVTNGAGTITLSLPQSINTTATPLFGRLALGGNSLISNRRITIEGTITGSTTAYGMDIFSTIQSDVTSTAFGYRSNLGTQPTAFTLSELIHFNVSSQGVGAGSSVTTQIGYRVQNNMIGATNTYGFQGLLTSAANTWNLYMSGTADNHLAGSLGIGTTSLTGYNLRVNKSITGSTTASNIFSQGQIQSDVTANVGYFESLASTQAAAFTLTNLYHFKASVSSFGAGSTVTNQFGYIADSSVVGGTNNYGFYGNLPSASTNWNIYMNGSAANYLNGNLQIGSSTPLAGAEKLQVTGTARVTGALAIGNTVQASVATPSTHKVTIVIGGVTYYLLATNV